MKARIDKVEVFADYGIDGFVHYIVDYCSGVRKRYRISSFSKPVAAEPNVPQTVLDFIHNSDFSETVDRFLFMREPAEGCKIPCGFVSAIYFNCPF